MAFQRDAFEEQAFQTGHEAKPKQPAFQADAFQGNAFQIGPPGGAAPAATDPFFQTLHRIEQGMVALTAAGMDGVLETA